MIDPLGLDSILVALGALLESRGHRFELAVVGGGSLVLLDLARRATRDLAVVALVNGDEYTTAQPLPADLVEAVSDVGTAFGLASNWLNNGPTELLDFGLPAGFEGRAERREYGSLVLHIASRLDQIHLKLYASVDQGPRSKHVADLTLLLPTRDELLAAARWTRQHDPSEGYREELVQALQHFGVMDADELV